MYIPPLPVDRIGQERMLLFFGRNYFAVFDTHYDVSHFRNILIVGNYYDGLVVIARHFKQ